MIQNPYDSQAYNRYSYVRNNPLKYSDPTGYSWWTKFRDKWVKPIVSIVISAVIVAGSGGLGLLGNTWIANLGMVGGGTLAGAVSGAIMTGSLTGAVKGSIFGMFGAGFASGIGGALGHSGGSIFSKGFALGKGFVKGVSPWLKPCSHQPTQGGTFKSGFASGFASSFFGPTMELGEKNATGFTVRTTIAGMMY